jgi:threonine synthase
MGAEVTDHPHLSHVLGLRCVVCGAEYVVGQVEYVCPKHGHDGILDVVYDYPRIARCLSVDVLRDDPTFSMWRYLPLLPLDPILTRKLVRGNVLEQVGWTPLYPAPRLAADLALHHLWIKDDGREPTASFKDRASAIAISRARELGCEVVTTASTGNAAAALAGLSAAVAQANVIFLPRSAPQAKIAQLLVFGAMVLLVDGTYDQAFDLCLQVAPEYGWYNRNTGYNPYMSEGKKTVAYEICEQLTTFLGAPGDAPLQAPDCVFVPVGDGCIIGGVHKGFRDLLALGWIAHVPRLMGVQATGSAALAGAWECGKSRAWTRPEEIVRLALEMQPIDVHTVADSIGAGMPRDRIKALRAVFETEGAFIRVDDSEILAAIPDLARGCGVFAEPAAAAAYAGLIKAVGQGMIEPDDRVVVLATGSGLKDVAAAIESVGQPPVVLPDLSHVRDAIHRLMGRVPGGTGRSPRRDS